MAREWTSIRSLSEDPGIQQFCLDDVVLTGKTLGVGSYGCVLEVMYNEIPCAAKQMHELLLDPDNEGVQETIQKYHQECQLMAGLRHPNITQFLGLFFLNSQLPLLVMEKLEMSVDDLLECCQDIALPVKMSIITDTCSGLVYLHGLKTPIVHRDLTARNVLLTSSLSAKITDLGNSRLLLTKPGRFVATMSKLPGTLVYMPPEALSDSHRYGPSLDVFSCGHLALYVLIQVFPGDILPATVVDPEKTGCVIGLTEIERRQVYMKRLDLQFSDTYPVISELVRKCLDNDPQARPSSRDLLNRIRVVKHEVDGVHGGSMARQLNVSSLLLLKELKTKDKTIRDLQHSARNLESENRELIAANLKLRSEMIELQSLKVEVDQVKTEIEGLKSSKEKLLDQYKMDIQKWTSERLSLNTEVKKLQTQINGEKILKQDFWPTKTPTLQQEWKKASDMPMAMSAYIQSVQINDTIYVGGGYTGKSETDYIVMAYNTQSNEWYLLPPYNTWRFAMTTINNKLILVGGRCRDYSDSKELGEWQPDIGKWIHPFPSMSIPRCVPSATSYKHYLVVAGGRGGSHGYCVSNVEVLNIMNMQWSTGPYTPTPWINMKSTTIGDTWYLMGGYDGKNDTPEVYSINLEALVSRVATDNSITWTTLPSLSYKESSPISTHGSLLAVGGRNVKNGKPVSTIQCFSSETNSWEQVGELPHVLYNCTCIVMSKKIYVLGGYYRDSRLKEVFTSVVM